MTSKTTLYLHPSSLAHDTGPGHPESAARIKALMELFDADFPDLPRVQAGPASREQILSAHPESYIQFIEDSLPAEGYAQIDGDTVLSPHSYDAALHAAGAACQATDDLCTGQTRRAFCAMRPPGHHAEPAKSMGFCLFANAYIAARQARNKYGLNRIAIVDFDVHHGNGTDALIRQHDHDCDGEILFISSHQYPLWPMTGVPEDNEAYVMNFTLLPESGSDAFRALYEQSVFPALEKFAPELLILSAGFDAHADDPLAQLHLNETDFGWVTTELCHIADTHAQGRVLSVLEGGYDINALTNSVKAHILALEA